MLRFTNATYMPRHELNEFQNRYSEQITASARTALRILGRRTNSISYFKRWSGKGKIRISAKFWQPLRNLELNWQRPLVVWSLTLRTMIPCGRWCCMISVLSVQFLTFLFQSRKMEPLSSRKQIALHSVTGWQVPCCCSQQRTLCGGFPLPKKWHDCSSLIKQSTSRGFTNNIW